MKEDFKEIGEYTKYYDTLHYILLIILSSLSSSALQFLQTHPNQVFDLVVSKYDAEGTGRRAPTILQTLETSFFLFFVDISYQIYRFSILITWVVLCLLMLAF